MTPAVILLGGLGIPPIVWCDREPMPNSTPQKLLNHQTLQNLIKHDRSRTKTALFSVVRHQNSPK